MKLSHYLLPTLLFITPSLLQAQIFPKAHFNGMYLQWGYNREIYTRSDIHFQNGNQYDFTIHDAKAVDKPDFDGIWNSPLDITIPQYSYRIGVYLNRQNTWAIELNFDHAKYVVNDDQRLRLSGQIAGEQIDKDTVIHRQFLHFEHTDGANFFHINYVHQKFLLEGKRYGKLSYLLKGGAGVVIPRTDVTYMGQRLNNKFHVAGYIISAEAGIRYYPLRNFFLELNMKGGYANYLNSLAIEGGGKANHQFCYGSVILLAGYELNFGHQRQHPAVAPL
ncbi:MAG: hypothetical protein JST06_04905 [Bacteroidetes bacterium]|nr:hypothetical protein [Bacteroidota bacterium]